MKLKVTMVGLGLIGGSLGMAIKKKKLARVIGLTREKSKAALAVKLKAVDYASTNIRGIIRDADIIFICYPIHLIVPEISKIIQFVKPGTIITDVGSSKGLIVKEAERIMPKGVFFVGGHPMAGGEKVGLEEAQIDLLEKKNYILTKTPKTNGKALSVLKALISKLGAKVHILTPDAHDSIVAGISHMPVAVAAALVDSVLGSGRSCSGMTQFAASGFRDSTRIASGSPDMGTDMFITNKKAVLAALASFKKSLAKIEKLIKQGDAASIKMELSQIKDFRDSIFK
ncbi:MAG: prephenate dehydrogenase/arogenate dehydrogenase family protein [bacterium]